MNVITICVDKIISHKKRLVKQAVQGLVHIGKRRAELRPVVMLKILQVINNPRIYRLVITTSKKKKKNQKKIWNFEKILFLKI